MASKKIEIVRSFRHLFLVVFSVISLLFPSCQGNNKKEGKIDFAETITSDRPFDEQHPPGKLEEKAKPYKGVTSEEDFSVFVSKNKIGFEQITGNENEVRYFTRYLGDMKIGSENFSVLSQYFEVQAAIEKHGHSRIIFFNKKAKSSHLYILDGSEDLPSCIKEENLIFEYGGKENFISIRDSLPLLICLPDDRGCY